MSDNTNAPHNQAEPPGKPDGPSSFYSPDSVFIMAVAVEAVLLFTATIWMVVAGLPIANWFNFSRTSFTAGLAAGLTITIFDFFLLYLSNRLYKSVFVLRSMRDLVYQEMCPLFSRLSTFQIVFLALSSGLAEEIFFRGVMEEKLGMFTTNFCFALAHFPRFYYFPYAVWAGAIGFLMSYLKLKTGTLYAPIICHTVINLFSLTVITRLKVPIETLEEADAEGAKPEGEDDEPDESN